MCQSKRCALRTIDINVPAKLYNVFILHMYMYKLNEFNSEEDTIDISNVAYV